MISKKRMREHFSVPGNQLVVLPIKSSSLKGRTEKEPSTEEVRLKNIVDMGISFSGMLRVFEADAKERFHEKTWEFMGKISSLNSQEEFNTTHKKLCCSLKGTIKTAIKQKNSKILKLSKKASYGQIAKTINVALKVLIYYTHFPSPQKAREVSGWLHAAVDTKMMDYLKKELERDCPKEFKDWPRTIEEVDSEEKYQKVQAKVKQFIKKRHPHNKITPVQFDDIYWRELNRKEKKNLQGNGV